MRDPFAMPSKLLEQNNSRQEQQIAPRQIQQTLSPNAPPRKQTVSPYAPEPCVAGIFDNGKEKFALVRWQQIQGIFRCGENLGNGYYIKEITANSVLLCPKKDSPGKNSMTLKLK